MTSAQAGGTYIYAVLAAVRDVGELGPIGIEGGEVYCVGVGDVAAAVSRVNRARLRPERKHLLSHHAVLQRLMERGTVLPAAFGLVARSDEAVRDGLREHRERLRQQLAHVDGKVEMGLKLHWNAPEIFEYFVATHPELGAVRASLLGRRDVGRDEMISVGKLFEMLRDADREAHAATVTAALNKCGVEVKAAAPHGDREVMSLSCLVPREGLPAFHQAVEALAAVFDDNFTFELTGPRAPHNFVSLKLQPATLAGGG